ncbi:MAG TPA: hypothetical protein VD971_08100 [Phycisphaerales bacterium]|nr:hypothetical protein [Phycisphaerales bacterium]
MDNALQSSDLQFEVAEDAIARGLVEDELEYGEQIIWFGRAARFCAPLYTLAPVVLLSTLFLMVGCMLALATIVRLREPHREQSAGYIFLWILLGFFALGAVSSMLNRWLHARAGRKGVYAVTEKRAIVILGWPLNAKREVRSFTSDSLYHVRVALRSDGSGDIVFREATTQGYSDFRLRTRPVGFMGIAEVKDAEAALRTLLNLNTGKGRPACRDPALMQSTS